MNAMHPVFANRGYQHGRVVLISTHTALVSMATGVFVGIGVLDEAWPARPLMSACRLLAFVLMLTGALSMNRQNIRSLAMGKEKAKDSHADHLDDLDGEGDDRIGSPGQQQQRNGSSSSSCSGGGGGGGGGEPNGLGPGHPGAVQVNGSQPVPPQKPSPSKGLAVAPAVHRHPCPIPPSTPPITRHGEAC
jgi:hypothetical protein